MFFDTLGIKWWYEPEGFALRFDYKKFASGWDMTEVELRLAGVPQTFERLDGRDYSYLPDFYLPELNYWIEIKGPHPTKAELEKAFMLYDMVGDAARVRIREANTEADQRKAFEDLYNQGVYILYGDIPWPFPKREMSSVTAQVIGQALGRWKINFGSYSWEYSTYAGKSVHGVRGLV